MGKKILIGLLIIIGTILILLVLSMFDGDRGNGEELFSYDTKNVKINLIPDNAEIVYHQEGFIYVMDRDGNNVQQITFGEPIFYEHVAISHDKRYVAGQPPFFEDNKLVSSKIVIFDTKEKKRMQLVPDFYDAGGGGIDFDPQGYLYFSGSKKNAGGRNIYKIRPDGTQLTQLTFLQQDIKARPPVPAVTSDISVSPDGSMVAFVFHDFEQTDNPIENGPIDDFRFDKWYLKARIYVMNSDGTNIKEVYDGGENTGIHGQNNMIGAYDPEISEDNKKVTFSVTNIEHENLPYENTAHDIWTINIDGDLSSLKRITKPGPISIIPDWKEDKILFWEADADDDYIGASIINTDGTGYKRIKKGAVTPKWIPSK